MKVSTETNTHVALNGRETKQFAALIEILSIIIEQDILEQEALKAELLENGIDDDVISDTIQFIDHLNTLDLYT